MDLLETIEALFHEDNTIVDVEKLNEIGDLLEYGNLSKEDVITIINCLLSYIKDLKDESIIENVFNISFNVMNAHSVFSGFNLEPVISCLDTLNTECASYAITLLGFSGNRQYKPILQSFLTNASLKEEAEEALFELNQ